MESFWPEYLQTKYLNWSTFCRFGLNLFKPSRWFVWIFSTILFTFLRTFWLGFIQDKTAITFWPITANYRTVNGKLLAWVFTSQILKLKHFLPFWPEFIQAKLAICLDFQHDIVYFCSYILDSIYSGQDCHNFLTDNCKLSHGEWKAFGLNIYKPNT
jgi:hypothetical protein